MAFAVTIIVLFVFAFAVPVGVSTTGAVLYFIFTVSCCDAVLLFALSYVYAVI